jgi:hypothetical protein
MVAWSLNIAVSKVRGTFQVAQYTALAGIGFAPRKKRSLRPMRDFFDSMINDMHCGRESWRVIAFLGSMAVAASVLYTWW